MISWFEKLTFLEFVAVLSLSNIAMYLGSWFIVLVVQRLFSKHLLNQKPALVTSSDYGLSFLIVLINIAVGIPGWWLWKQGMIQLVEPGWWAGLADGMVIFFYFDLSMYCLHRLMHVGWLYRWFHRRHHDHIEVTGISFYIMNPVEAVGFGVLLIGFLMLRPFSFHALMVYLFFNWMYGTMGHSGVSIKNRLIAWCVGDTKFHHQHHAKLSGNYGFYTGLWDRLFGTVI